MTGIQSVGYSEETLGVSSHIHGNVHQIIFILSGQLTISIGEKEYQINRPSAVFVSHLEPHSFTVTGDRYRRFCINLYPDAIERNIKNEKLLSILSNRPEGFCHIIDIEPLLPRLIPMLSEMEAEFCGDDGEFRENAVALLKSVLIMLYRHAPEAFPFESNNIAAIIHLIKHRIESDLTYDEPLEDIAGQFHLSRYYLAHCYKQITGYSIKNYRMLCRIAAARELLTSTSLSVSEICERVGFSDMSNFSRYFKKEEGMSPLQYRRIHRS